MLLCGEPLAVEMRKEQINTLEETLTKLDTHPDLITMFRMGSKSVTSTPMVDITGHDDEDNLSSLILKQNKILGWYFFLEGIWYVNGGRFNSVI